MNTDFLSIYRQKITHQISQLYSNLLPIQCVLCGASSKQHHLCIACSYELPQLEHACPHCATPLNRNALCGQCLHHPPQQDSSFSLYRYDAPIDRLIADMKYHGKLYLIDFFARQMAEKLRYRSLPELLIPIPLHSHRLKQRGYNQAWELTKILGRQLHIPVQADVLIKNKNTPPQASLPFSQRKQNMVNAFQLKNSPKVKHIALIDDVLTTGHTANVAAKELRKSAIVHIELWTIARTIRHD